MTTLSRRELLAGAIALAAAPTISAAQAAASGPFVTRHSGTFNGRRLDYLATVSETRLGDASGKPTASFWSTSYVADLPDRASRPVMFAFNGGPSAPSSYLHALAFGPKRLPSGQDPAQPSVGEALVDNPRTVLDVADLVFVDPAETGWSRVLPDGKREYFYSVNGDAQSVSDFVVAWCKANGREASPKYVFGESYGTMRAAVMAGQLASVMPLDGVCLFGQAVNMIETSQRAKNALAYATNITALAAVAQYHGLSARGRGRTVAALVDDAYAFGMGEYLQALVRGHDLPERERKRIAATLEAYTGIRADYYLAHDLAITKIEFAKEQLRDRGRFLAIYDARFTGARPAQGEAPRDPMGPLLDAVKPQLLRYYAEDLGVTLPAADYRSIAPDVDTWEWNGTLSPGGPFLDFDYQARISEAFRANPKFRLMIGTGYYDLTTTIGPARYLVTRSDYPRDRVFQREYVGGHVAYIHEPSLAAVTNDVRAWVTGGRPA
jgi:carboxypeptidase C (cathepsin A)